MYHYVYYSYESWGRGYIGVRSSKVPPQEDSSYFGSFYDKTFKPTNKIIILTFDTRKEALEAEILLHSFYHVDKNAHFANLARQTTVKFVSCGKRSEEFKQKVSQRMRGRKLTPEHIRKVSEARSRKLKGRKFSEEHKKKISVALKGRLSGVKRGKEMRKTSRKVVLKNVKTGEILYFDSISRASEGTGIARSNIYHMIKKPSLINKGYELVLGDS